MKRSRAARIALTALSAVLAAACATAALADAKFGHLAVRLEQNATDNDFEVVFEATGGDTGLASLQVAAPDGRIVIDFKAAEQQAGHAHDPARNARAEVARQPAG